MEGAFKIRPMGRECNYLTGMKYAIHPGWIGNTYLSFSRLVKLYGLKEMDCVEYTIEPPAGQEAHYIHLHPREDGVYHSPEKTDYQK